jgi:hypothetical protein
MADTKVFSRSGIWEAYSGTSDATLGVRHFRQRRWPLVQF